jgi:6-phosphofructokinase 2
VLAEAGRRLFAKAAKVQVVSKVGAGDSFVAGFVLSLARGADSAAALAYGAAAASAAVTTDATQLCRLADVNRLLPDCTVSEI